MKNKNSKDNTTRLFTENKGKPIKILLGFYKGETKSLLISTFYLMLQHSPVWISPIVTTNIINIVTYPDQHSMKKFVINISILLIFLLQNIFTTYSVSKYFDRLVRKIEHNLRSCLIQKLQSLSISFHRNNSSGKLLSKIMRDCENIESIMSQLFRTAFTIIVDSLIAIVITMKKSPIVLLFFLGVIPLEIIALRSLKKKIKKENTDFRSEIEETQSEVSEMLELIPVTRAHGLQNREITKMGKRLDAIMNVGYQLDKSTWIFAAISWVIMQVSQLACLAFTGYLAYKKKITVGEVVLYQTYFSQIAGQVNSLFNIYPQITKGLESINSVSEVLTDDRYEINNKIIPITDLKGKVEFRDIKYKYEDGASYVLDDFSVTVNPGESIAFVGGSGAGKSTILNLLIGFDRPQSGKILIDGINMTNLDLTEFRKQIAVVPQNTILFSGTIRDNIAYGSDNVSDLEIKKVLEDVGLWNIVNGLPDGMYSHLGVHGSKLSGGQKQRISIARALLRDPKIIIFDEATSALDSKSEKQVQKAVDKMMKHCTTFLVAHRLSTIKNADKIAVVDGGKIVEIGTYDELMEKQGIFYSLKKLQE